jgi:hypothetical protein
VKKDRKIRKFLKEYFGPLPILGGTFTAGVVGTAAFLITLISGFSKGIPYVLNGSNPVDLIGSIYQQAGVTAGQLVMPAYAAGQFLTYRMKKSILSVFQK